MRQIFAFCASYKDGTSAKSYTKRMKHTQAKSHNSERLTDVKITSSDTIILWSEKTALFGFAVNVVFQDSAWCVEVVMKTWIRQQWKRGLQWKHDADSGCA